MTHDLAKLRDLAGRLERATGPDRELDAAIDAAFNAYGSARPSPTKLGFVIVKYEASTGTHRACDLTASIDAAMFLVERLLLGWAFSSISESQSDGKYRWYVEIWHPQDDSQPGAIGESGWTLPLAILRTLTAALIAQAEEREESSYD